MSKRRKNERKRQKRKKGNIFWMFPFILYIGLFTYFYFTSKSQLTTAVISFCNEDVSLMP